MIGPIAKKIGTEVAEGLSKKVAPAAKKVVKAVEDKVDDWGWKGGKKGEVTGGDMEKAVRKYEKNKNIDQYEEVERKAGEQLTASLSRKPNSPMAKRYGTRVDQNMPASKYTAYDVLSPFASLERADIPRAWTGKVMNAIIEKHGNRAYAAAPREAKTISDLMRPMTNAQRETFVKLYPEWEQSLEDLARAARTL